MAETLAKLEAEYCPPIDPALLSAILSDYDLSKNEDLALARNTLDSLKESALVEEAAGFDASGTGGLEDAGDSGERVESYPETNTSQSKETDTTSVSNQLSSLGIDGVARPETPSDEDQDIEKLDDATKVLLLQDVFGEQVTRYSVEIALKKCNGRWSAALEELLNHVYLKEGTEDVDAGIFRAKGIDGFAEEGRQSRGRKGKAKNKRIRNLEEKRSSSLPGLHNEGPGQSASKWVSAVEDIEFIASRTGISNSTVSSVYYESGASLPKTIAVLLKASTEESKYVVTDEMVISTKARELSREFPLTTMEDLSTILRLTHPSVEAARELATAMIVKPQEGSVDTQIVPQYARPDTLDVESAWSAQSRKTSSVASSRSPSSDRLPAAARRDAYDLARAAALTQASAARRKARSDQLMSGAAAYYSQVSREYGALSSNASAQAADELVSAQSTATQLDLHGVDVRNAVRIAQEKVEEWWDRLGENRVNGRIGASERQSGYSIVVGRGIHSQGGNSRLGPAVTKMLRQEGWRAELTGGVVVVRGPVRN